MKDLKLIIPVIVLLLFTILIENKINTNLQTGDFAFISFKAIQNEGFSIITFKEIKPNSTFYFTDSEWNGNRFGKDESTLIWNTGNHTINSGTKINFNNIDTNATASIGEVKNTLKLSKDNEALFAYIGSAPKVPNVFIAAVANQTTSYGTLLNTGLIDGKTAITYPNNTYQAEYTKEIDILDKDILTLLNNMSNYSINNSDSKYLNSKLVSTN